MIIYRYIIYYLIILFSSLVNAKSFDWKMSIDTFRTKSTCSDIEYDNERKVYIRNNKPINGLIFCRDTMFLKIGNADNNSMNDYSYFFREGKLLMETHFHENGKIHLQLEYNIENGQLQYPIYTYNKKGLMTEKIELTQDSIIKIETYSYDEIDDSLKYIYYSASSVKNEYFKTHMGISSHLKMPIEISSIHKKFELLDGVNINFKFYNKFEINRIQYFIAEINNNKKRDESVLFQNDEIEYYEDLKIKSIKRSYQNLKLNEYALFSPNGELIEFKIFSDEKVYFNFRKK